MKKKISLADEYINRIRGERVARTENHGEKRITISDFLRFLTHRNVREGVKEGDQQINDNGFIQGNRFPYLPVTTNPEQCGFVTQPLLPNHLFI